MKRESVSCHLVSRQTPGEGENAAGFRAVNAQPELCPGILSTDSEAQRASNLARNPLPPPPPSRLRAHVPACSRRRGSVYRISARVPVNDGVEALEYRQLLPSGTKFQGSLARVSVFRVVRSFSGFTRCGDLERRRYPSTVRSFARIHNLKIISRVEHSPLSIRPPFPLSSPHPIFQLGIVFAALPGRNK